MYGGFVSEDGKVNATTDPASFLEHFGGHGLLDEFHTLGFGSIDFADRLFYLSIPRWRRQAGWIPAKAEALFLVCFLRMRTVRARC